MTTPKQSLVAQITVAVIVGLVSSMGTGSMTAYVLTNKFDKKLDAHIIQNESEAAQIRRDIARIEQSNVHRDQDRSVIGSAMNAMAQDLAFIRGKYETK